MLIVIPSAGRDNMAQQVTVRNFLSMKSKRKLLLAVPEKERQHYWLNVSPSNVEIVPVPSNHSGIGKTREWILTELAQRDKDGHVLMIDDDMDFCYRPDMSNEKLEMISTLDRLEEMLNTLESWLSEGFVHVGLSARQNNHQFPSGDDYDLETGQPREWRDAARMMNMYAYNAQALAKLGVKLGRVTVMEDFDLTLQLLRKGKPNRVSYRFCWNQRGSGLKGGCSTYRTLEMQAEAAHRLAELHPGLIHLKEKKSKASSGSWSGMKERTDVTVYWRRAYEEGAKS